MRLMCSLLFFLVAMKVNAAEPLALNCAITFSNYSGVKSKAHFYEVVLAEHKHKAGGRVQLLTWQAKEFWVMTHGIQSLGEREFINSFQVAIKNVGTREFYHALSDRTFVAGQKPQVGRLSLVEYDLQSGLEAGELLFECRS